MFFSMLLITLQVQRCRIHACHVNPIFREIYPLFSGVNEFVLLLLLTKSHAISVLVLLQIMSFKK